MTGKRLDFYKECNNLAVPPQEFEAAFCKRCYQPECTRSLFGIMKFDQRVATWHDRLFANPPQMDPTDPRAKLFTAKQFQIIDPQALTQASSDWMDPRDTRSATISVPVNITPEPTPAPEIQQTKVEFQGEDTPPEAPPSQNLPKEVVLINTPISSGQMLKGAPLTAPRAKRDQWDAPQGVRPGEKVIKAGAKIRLGGVEEADPKPSEGDSK